MTCRSEHRVFQQAVNRYDCRPAIAPGPGMSATNSVTGRSCERAADAAEDGWETKPAEEISARPGGLYAHPGAVFRVVVDDLCGIARETHTAGGSRIAGQITRMNAVNRSAQPHPVRHPDTVNRRNFTAANPFRDPERPPRGIFAGTGSRYGRNHGNAVVDQQKGLLATDIDHHSGVTLVALREHHLMDARRRDRWTLVLGLLRSRVEKDRLSFFIENPGKKSAGRLAVTPDDPAVRQKPRLAPGKKPRAPGTRR